jgi:hypothetical protein
MNRFALVGLAMVLGATSSSAQSGTARATGKTSAPGKTPATVTWVRYDDPAERAFSIEVPQGWEVQGGLYRFGYFDTRWMVDARSPDGKIILRLNDASVPPYSLPGPNLPREGMPYVKPQQYQMMVERYRTGQSYAEMYARSRFKSVCQSLTPRPEDAKPAPSATTNAGGQTVTEGSATYDCATSDAPRIASVYARSVLYPAPSNYWVLDPVISALVTPDNATASAEIVRHMWKSFHPDPQWEEYQNRMTQAGLESVRRNFQAFMSQIQAYHQARTNAMNQQVAGFNAKMNAQQQQVTRFGEVMTGLQEARDPMTGQQFQVWSGPGANYYRDGLGNTVNSNTSPGTAYHQLDTSPH